MAKGTVKKEVKKVPSAPFESQSYGLVKLANAINESMAQSTKVSIQLLEYLKKQETKKNEINITVPEIKIPTLPEIKVPPIKVPSVNIPEQKPVVFMPNINVPEIKIPEQKIINGWKFKINRNKNLLIDTIDATKVE